MAEKLQRKQKEREGRRREGNGEKRKGKFLCNKQTGTRLSKLFMKKAGE